MVKMWHFFYFFLSSTVTKRFDFCQLFSTLLKRFCPLDSKNVFVLVLAHLEPKLDLFEANDIGDDGDDDCGTIIQGVSGTETKNFDSGSGSAGIGTSGRKKPENL